MGSSNDRDPRVDGLRGIAILLVMLFHTAQWGAVRARSDVALTALPSVGWIGVDLFFVLSGYLITNILLATRESARYATTFYARRTLRIFPLYYAVLALLLVVAPRVGALAEVEAAWSAGHRGEDLGYWLYLSNVDIALAGWGHRALTVTWSLAVEEHFYLLWPWVVRRVPESRLLGVCAALAAFSLLARVALVASGASPLAPYVLTPCRFDGFAAGAALAVLARRPGGLAPLAPSARRAFAGAAWVFLTITVSVRVAPSRLPLAQRVHDLPLEPWMATVGYTALCVLWGAGLLLLLTAGPHERWPRAFELPALRSLGRHGYALYLLHMPVAIAIGQVFPPRPFARHFALAQVAYWALAIGATYALARVSWIALEAPLLRLKDRFPYRV